MGKRVYCLYRVSTKGQVEKDDIPMQKQRCREFAAEKGWSIAREFSEKGVSGFKVSAKDRDAIQEIQRDAAQDKFDVLLVFMFDRLGRKEDETPFVVEWFVQDGIEVWSAEEGQQRFDNHVDKLMNYIRYWQASGESLKTSVRTKTRLAQIVQEGRFRGGSAPFGYKLVKNGRVGKKNKELYDIEVEPTEAMVVREIFDLADRFGYGGRRISSELIAKGIKNERTGEHFHYSSIQNILRNIMYVGILRSGEARSEIIPELQIVSQEQYDRVAKGRSQRSADYERKCAARWEAEVVLVDGVQTTVNRPPRISPRKNVGRALLSGNVYCGHCGGRIFASTACRSHDPNDRVSIYKCYNRTQHKTLCNGPTTYRAERVDAVVETLLRNIFERARAVNESELIQQQVQETAAQCRQKLRKAQADHSKAMRELTKWENLMLDSIEGTCVFSPEQIKRRMDTVQETVAGLAEQIDALKDQAAESEYAAKEIRESHQRLLSWAELFDTASVEEKKMIASYLIKAVTLTRDYGIEVEFSVSEAQYLGGMEMG